MIKNDKEWECKRERKRVKWVIKKYEKGKSFNREKERVRKIKERMIKEIECKRENISIKKKCKG